jgi:hypothetical protein
MSIGFIYVDEHYSGWKEQCLRVLQSKFDSQSRSFAPNKEIAEALKECPIGQEMNLKQVQKLCMPFIKKKEGPGIGGWSSGVGQASPTSQAAMAVQVHLDLDHIY